MSHGANRSIQGIGIGVTNLIDAKRPWPDYTYDECLTLVFNIMREKNPELSGEKKKFAMKPPEVNGWLLYLILIFTKFTASTAAVFENRPQIQRSTMVGVLLAIQKSSFSLP